MKDFNVLQKATKNNICFDPFPHIVIENALDNTLYQKLVNMYPNPEYIMNVSCTHSNRWKPSENNIMYQLRSEDILQSKEVDDLWKRFVQYHTSEKFYQQVCNLFGFDRLFQHHPKLKSKATENKLTVGIRSKKNKTDLGMECAIRVNSPVTQQSTVRAPHIDANSTVFVGLYYFRDPADTSTGGDLAIYKHNDSANFIVTPFKLEQKAGRTYMNSNEIASNITLVKTIKYQPNTLIFFINSDQAVHAVTERSITPHYRKLINIIGTK